MGENFTVADAYLHAILNWSGHLKVDLPAGAAGVPSIAVAARPAVQAAKQAEHTAKATATA